MAEKTTKKPAAKKTAKKKDDAPKKPTMKGTDAFIQAIQDHLRSYCMKDRLFLEKLKNPKKNIIECVNYIIDQVKATGKNGFEDEEIFQLARHYYDEEDIKVKNTSSSGEIIMNQEIPLTDEEIAEAKQKALDNIQAKEEKRIQDAKKKAEEREKKKLEAEEKKREEAKGEQGSLF